MKNKVIYIKREDDLASVVEKIILSKEEEIILVFPREANLSTHKINFQILKREAEYAGKELFVDTESEVVKKFCKDENIKLVDDYSELLGERREKEIPVTDIIAPSQSGGFKKEIDNIPSLEKEEGEEEDKKRKEGAGFWEALEEKRLKHKKKNKLSSEPTEESREAGSSEENISDISFSREFVGVRKSRKWYYLIGVSSFVGLLIISYLVAFILPRAEVVINAQKEEKEFSFPLTVDKKAEGINLENYTIPGKILTFERTARNVFPATGSKKVESKASGIIRIYNAYSSKPQILVATTRFLSSSGKLFRIPRRILIPGAKIVQGKIIPSYVDVKVFADKYGESYNIGPDKFTIPGFKGSPKYYGFYAQSFEPMKGGEVKEVKVVSKDDLEKAKKEVEKQISFLLEGEFEEKIPEGYYKAENNWILTKKEIKADAKAGEEKNSFIVDADFVMKGAIFKKDDLYNLAQDIFNKLPETKDWNIKGLGFSFSEPEFDAEKGIFKLSSKVDFDLIRKIDSQEIEKEILSRKAKDIKKILLSRPEIQSARVIFWPFWVDRVPKNTSKVKIIIN